MNTNPARRRRVCRLLMSAWARRWRVIRNDDQQRPRAAAMITNAIRLRNISL